MLVLIALVVIVLVLSGVRYFNRLNRAGGSGRARTTNGRLRDKAAAGHRQNLAAREQLQDAFGPAAFEARVKRPLGLTFQSSPDPGVEVLSVSQGSAAYRIGVQVGAQLTAIGGIPVNDPAEVDAAIDRQVPGLPLYLVWRFDGQEFRREVML